MSAFKRLFLSTKWGNREILPKKGAGGRTTQFINVETYLKKSYISLYPGFLTFTLHMSSRQEVQKHKGNQYENCERLLINQLTQTLQVRGFYKHFN